jgi:hypothetical protein
VNKLKNQKINKDFQFEVTIEEDTIHDPKFVETREENFQKG